MGGFYFVSERRMLADLRVGEGSVAEGKGYLLHSDKGRLGKKKVMVMSFIYFTPTNHISGI